MFVHEIQLPEVDDFSKRFNTVSKLYAKWEETNEDSDFEAFFQAKYALEQGLPISE